MLHSTIVKWACLAAIASISGCAGCEPGDEDPFAPHLISCDMGPAADLAPAPDMAKKRCNHKLFADMPGDVLFCANIFDEKPASESAEFFNSWTFNSTNNIENGWRLSGDKSALEVKSFSVDSGGWSFTVPAISQASYASYEFLTLAIVQSINLNEDDHKAQIMNGAIDTSRLIYRTTGKIPAQVSTITIQKSAIPGAVSMPNNSGNFSPTFYLFSTAAAGGGNKGWRIEAIAIFGKN